MQAKFLNLASGQGEITGAHPDVRSGLSSDSPRVQGILWGSPTEVGCHKPGPVRPGALWAPAGYFFFLGAWAAGLHMAVHCLSTTSITGVLILPGLSL